VADAAVRSTAARIAALTRWTHTRDRRAATQAARDGLLARYRREILAEFPGLTDEAEIASRIEGRLRLHYERMRAASLRSRRAAAQDRVAAIADAIAQADHVDLT
jgi:hypothetical protein